MSQSRWRVPPGPFSFERDNNLNCSSCIGVIRDEIRPQRESALIGLAQIQIGLFGVLNQRPIALELSHDAPDNAMQKGPPVG